MATMTRGDRIGLQESGPGAVWWGRLRRVLPLLTVALSLLTGPATGQAQRAGPPCRAACWYRVRVSGYATGFVEYTQTSDENVVSDKTASHDSFVLESLGAVIVGPTLEMDGELGGHLTHYFGHKKVTNMGHIQGCNVQTTSNLRGEPPLGAMLYIEGPQDSPSVRLGVTYDPSPHLNFFHNATPAYKCGAVDVKGKASDEPVPQVSAGPNLGFPTEGTELHIPLAEFISAPSGAVSFSLRATYHAESPTCGVSCYRWWVDGEVIMEFKRCPDQHLHWNCPIRSWDPLPKRR
jgi:hypothetical protein